ncbi:MAG: tetratricopeptide repeat-containing sensor histidine kinase [Lentimicrobiaceae bacterium]|nr:tetratricopeptide repeat-containing sensor histidine kinase [Lentimicrobiaceae bacterium]
MKRLILFLLIVLAACSGEISREASVVRYENADCYEKAQQYMLVPNYDSAMIYLNQALEWVDTNNHQELANIYLLRSNALGKLTQFENSMEDALKALSISENHQLVESKVQALLNIGNIYYLMYNDEKAEEFMLKAKTLAEEKELPNEIMQIYGKLGELYKATKRTDEALPLLLRALEIAQNQSDTLNLISCLRMLGDYYITLNRWTNPIVKEYQQTAKKYLDEAMHLAVIKNVPAYQNQIYGCLIRWCRIEKNYTTALAYAQEVIKNSTDNDYSMLLQAYDHLVAVYAYLGDAEKAIQSQQDFRALMIKQSDVNLHRSMQEMATKYETAEKELEIVRQQAEIKHHKMLQYIYIGILAAAGLLIIASIYTVRQRTKRNKELREINALKDKFFAIISHDLKNPAIAQRNALQVLAENGSQFKPDLLSQYFTELLKSADYQVSLLYNLLNWASVQTGRMPYKPTTFDIVEALRSEVAMIQNMAAPKNINLTVQMPDRAVITGDRNMLITVIRNLLTNAVKFTGSGGTITLEISQNSISVSDTGTGMNAEQLQNLFRIDKQHSKPGTSGEQGSGLGLIVCKEFIEKHGSQLHVESKQGEGSRFWFEV